MINQMFQQPLTEISSTRKDILGSLRWQFDSTNKKWKCYKYVVLKTAPTADVDCVAGDAICYTDYSANEVGVDITDQEAKLAAGIALAAIDMSADKGKYIWIQVKGHCTVAQTVGNSAVAGDEISLTGTGAADKTFTKATTILPKCGVLIHAANKEVYLECPV